MAKRKMICIEAETNSGKDTLTKRLRKDGVPIVEVVSYTTRPRRINETEGVEHFFISPDQMATYRDNYNIIAYTKFKSPNSDSDGYECFVAKELLGNANCYIIDPPGVDYMKERVDFELLRIHLYAPKFIRKRRSKKRGDEPGKFEERYDSECQRFKDYRKKKEYDIMIHNYSIFGKLGYRKIKKEIIKFLNEGDAK